MIDHPPHRHDPGTGAEGTSGSAASSVLDVSGLTVGYRGDDGEIVELVSDVSFRVAPGEVLSLVGESGSGKSVTSLAVLGLLPEPLEILSGTIRHRGQDVLAMSRHERRALRGGSLAMVFQDPMTALNPVRRVGPQIARALAIHQPALGRRERNAHVVELLEAVGVPQAASRARAYPHEWSGGMRQRAVIAMAMANSPDLMIADEPTTALDATVQAQVMEALATARERASASMILITHDLGLVAQAADRVAIMYAGRIVETGTVWQIFDEPGHPYTRSLLASILTTSGRGGRAYAIPGSPPLATRRATGCAFAPRCPSVGRDALCAGTVPPLVELGTAGRTAACHHLEAEVDLTGARARAGAA